MKESKAIYVTKRDIKVELSKDHYTNKRTRDNEFAFESLRYVQKTQEVGCQYDSKRDNLICTCRNLPSLRKKQEVRYFGFTRQIYSYQRSRSNTDIGVGSVKALQRKKVRKIYLPETDDRGVGSSDLSSYFIRRTRQHRPSSYYDNKRTSSKCVGGILEYNTDCVMNEKLSPIVKTVSGSTSPKSSRFNRNIEIGSNTVVKSLTNTTTQVEDYVAAKIDTNFTKEAAENKPEITEAIKPVLVREDIKEMRITGADRTKTTVVFNKLEEKDYSSDSLVQHVHNLENPSDEKQSHASMDPEDPMENKLEREYRRIFTQNLGESKPSTHKPIPEFKSTSTLKRRFEALRRGLAKKEDSKRNTVFVTKISSHLSVQSRKDVSINSDPPSLEGRSYSNTKTYSPYPTPEESYSQDKSSFSRDKSVVYHPRISHYRRSVTGRKERASSQWSSRVDDDDSENQGVKGMFKLWGKKFNFEEDNYKRRPTPKPSYNHSKKSEKVRERVEKNDYVRKPDVEEKKEEKRKFFFFKKKNKEQKEKNYKDKKGVTAGRCEVRDGLFIRVGGNNTFPEDIVKKPEMLPEQYEDMVRKAWLKKFLSHAIESRNSVQVRWNNKTYATSSSTVFELMDNVYKDTGVVFRSKSQVTIQSSYKSYTKQHVNFVHQNIEAWMIPKTCTDKKLLPAKVKCKSNEDRRNNIEVTISDQKWFIDKSKAFSHKIEVVLHSKNFVKLNKEASSEYLRIDIPKGFFLDSSSDDNNKNNNNQSSDEEVYKIVEYETETDLKKEKPLRSYDIGDHKQNNIKVSVSVKESRDCDWRNLETVIKRPLVNRDVIIQGSNVYIPKRCNVVGVGIITQRDMRDAQKPILKIQDDYTDDESEHKITLPSQKKCEFAESYLQEYYRNWTPLGIDLYSWCISDSHLKCCSDHSITSFHHNQGDVTKSCPNIFEDFQTSTIISSCGASSCSQCHGFDETLPPDKCKWFKKSKKKEFQDLNSVKRVLPKDSIEVFKRRKIYAASNKSKWAACPVPSDSKCEPYCVPSNESKGCMPSPCPPPPCPPNPCAPIPCPPPKACGPDPCGPKMECPKLFKSCCKPVIPPPRRRPCKKHVSLPDCDTMNEMLARQLSREQPEGILAFKGVTTGCDACKKKEICPKHATIIPNPLCEIPRAPCRDSCEKMKKAPCAKSKTSCENPNPPPCPLPPAPPPKCPPPKRSSQHCPASPPPPAPLPKCSSPRCPPPKRSSQHCPPSPPSPQSPPSPCCPPPKRSSQHCPPSPPSPQSPPSPCCPPPKRSSQHCPPSPPSPQSPPSPCCPPPKRSSQHCPPRPPSPQSPPSPKCPSPCCPPPKRSSQHCPPSPPSPQRPPAPQCSAPKCPPQQSPAANSRCPSTGVNVVVSPAKCGTPPPCPVPPSPPYMKKPPSCPSTPTCPPPKQPPCPAPSVCKKPSSSPTPPSCPPTPPSCPSTPPSCPPTPPICRKCPASKKPSSCPPSPPPCKKLPSCPTTPPCKKTPSCPPTPPPCKKPTPCPPTPPPSRKKPSCSPTPSKKSKHKRSPPPPSKKKSSPRCPHSPPSCPHISPRSGSPPPPCKKNPPTPPKHKKCPPPKKPRSCPISPPPCPSPPKCPHCSPSPTPKCPYLPPSTPPSHSPSPPPPSRKKAPTCPPTPPPCPHAKPPPSPASPPSCPHLPPCCPSPPSSCPHDIPCPSPPPPPRKKAPTCPPTPPPCPHAKPPPSPASPPSCLHSPPCSPSPPAPTSKKLPSCPPPPPPCPNPPPCAQRKPPCPYGQPPPSPPTPPSCPHSLPCPSPPPSKKPSTCPPPPCPQKKPPPCPGRTTPCPPKKPPCPPSPPSCPYAKPPPCPHSQPCPPSPPPCPHSPPCPPSPSPPSPPPCPHSKPPPCPYAKPLPLPESPPSCPHLPPCRPPPSSKPPPCPCDKPPSCPHSPPCPPSPPSSPPSDTSIPPSPPPCCHSPPCPPPSPPPCCHSPPCPPPSPPPCCHSPVCPSATSSSPPSPPSPPICPHSPPCNPPPMCQPKSPPSCPHSPPCSPPSPPPLCPRTQMICPSDPSSPQSGYSMEQEETPPPATRPPSKKGNHFKKLFCKKKYCPSTPPTCPPPPICPASQANKPNPQQSPYLKFSTTSCSFGSLRKLLEAPFASSPHPNPEHMPPNKRCISSSHTPQPEPLAFPESECDSRRTSNDEFPWPTKNQVSNQSSVASLCEYAQEDKSNKYGKCIKKRPLLPMLSCETIPSPKPSYNPTNQAAPSPCNVSKTTCLPLSKPPSPPSTPSTPLTPPSPLTPTTPKDYSTAKSKVSGLYLRKKPKKTTVSKDCLAWGPPYSDMEDGYISLNSEEKITIRLKKEIPSAEEIREGLNIKVQDEDGMTLFERKDYRLHHADCSLHKRSVLGEMYKTSEVRRVVTSNSVQAIGSAADCNQIGEGISAEPSIANLIEIQFKFKVIQGEKTAEVNIANDEGNETDHEEIITKRDEINKQSQVYVVKEGVEQSDDLQSDQKNDINIRIVIKNFKPKTGKTKSDSIKQHDYNKDFSQKISSKFHTVSTGYSDDFRNDKVFSVHRATVDLTSSVEKSKTHSNKSEELMSETTIEQQSYIKFATTGTSEGRVEDSDGKSNLSKKYSICREQDYPETDVEGVMDNKYDTEAETDTDKVPDHRYDTEETDTEKPPDHRYDTEETDTDKPPEPKYDTEETDTDKVAAFMSTDSEPETIPENKSIQVIVKPHTKDEKKELLKHLFQKAHQTKVKNKTRMKKLKDMLKVILTSDSSDHDESKQRNKNLAKDVTYASLKPNYFRDSDSMNNYYKTESTAAPSDGEINKVFYPPGERNSSASNPSEVLTSEAETPKVECMCRTLAARLKMAARIGEENCCCCAPKKVSKKNEEVSCDFIESDHVYDCKTEYVNVETQNSRYLTSKMNSTNISIHSRSVQSSQIGSLKSLKVDSGVINVDDKHFKTLSPHMHHVRQSEMRKPNRNTFLSISDEDKIVLLSTKPTRVPAECAQAKQKKYKDSLSVFRASDILQSYETKKAVLEIYTEKTVSDEGERLVAKLPKFVYDRENEIHTNYEAMAKNTYKAVCKRDIVMMAINR